MTNDESVRKLNGINDEKKKFHAEEGEEGKEKTNRKLEMAFALAAEMIEHSIDGYVCD